MSDTFKIVLGGSEAGYVLPREYATQEEAQLEVDMALLHMPRKSPDSRWSEAQIEKFSVEPEEKAIVHHLPGSIVFDALAEKITVECSCGEIMVQSLSLSDLAFPLFRKHMEDLDELPA